MIIVFYSSSVPCAANLTPSFRRYDGGPPLRHTHAIWSVISDQKKPRKTTLVSLAFWFVRFRRGRWTGRREGFTNFIDGHIQCYSAPSARELTGWRCATISIWVHSNPPWGVWHASSVLRVCMWGPQEECAEIVLHYPLSTCRGWYFRWRRAHVILLFFNSNKVTIKQPTLQCTYTQAAFHDGTRCERVCFLA